MQVNLIPFLRSGLDVLFVGLNPPVQSNSNKHYFSGDKSAFFNLLAMSGLITQQVDKAFADEIVFGGTTINYRNKSFGVIDLVDDVVETNSSQVSVTKDHVDRLIKHIHDYKPRFVCIIHSEVRNAFIKHGKLKLYPGYCGKALPDSTAQFVVNYFPNGNNITNTEKIRIFQLLKDRL